MIKLDSCPAQTWDRLWCVYSPSQHRQRLQGFLDRSGESSNACSVEHSAPRAQLLSATEWRRCSQHGWAFSGFYFCKFAERISTYRSQGTIAVLCEPDRPPEHFSAVLFLMTALSFSTQPLTPALHQWQQTGGLPKSSSSVVSHTLHTEILNSHFSGTLSQFPL